MFVGAGRAFPAAVALAAAVGIQAQDASTTVFGLRSSSLPMGMSWLWI